MSEKSVRIDFIVIYFADLFFNRKFPIVTLTGPRQSGKSTLLKSVLTDYDYVSMEDPDNRLFVTEDPRGFIRTYPDKTIIDEVQRVPELFSYLQTHVDAENREGMYYLAGSQNFLLMQSISQSLAGRTAIYTLPTSIPTIFRPISRKTSDC